MGSQTICTTLFLNDKDMPVRRAPVDGGDDGIVMENSVQKGGEGMLNFRESGDVGEESEYENGERCGEGMRGSPCLERGSGTELRQFAKFLREVWVDLTSVVEKCRNSFAVTFNTQEKPTWCEKFP